MYAVIDLGSNSFHLLIAAHSGRGFAVVDRCSKKIQLADGLASEGRLNSAAIQRGLDCLKEFKRILSAHPIRHLRVVATQALREAENASCFLDQAKALGFQIEIISGAREAELIFHGIMDALPPSDDNRLIIDIGGASTEIALGNSSHILFACSVPIGCVRWRDRFFSDGLSYCQSSGEAKRAAVAALQPALVGLQGLSWRQVFASSGSAKMLASIGEANRWSSGEIKPACIDGIETALKDVKHPGEIQLAGLKEERRDLLAAGACIMGSIMESLKIESITYCATALREGILSEMAANPPQAITNTR